MRVDEMISRATHTSGRSALAVSLVVVASGLLEFGLDSLPLFNQGGLDDLKIRKVALPLIVFLIIAHILNWVNDLNGYLLNDKKRWLKILMNSTTGCEMDGRNMKNLQLNLGLLILGLLIATAS